MNPHPTSTDTTSTDTTSTDTTSTDTTSTDTTSTGSAVTITEIAEFLQQLRALSRPGAADPSRDADPTRDAGDATAERATFLARKADLLARIAAAPSPTAPPPTAPSPTDGDPT